MLGHNNVYIDKLRLVYMYSEANNRGIGRLETQEGRKTYAALERR
jgi:hypothetical protein